jgi:hypothetical protein
MGGVKMNRVPAAAFGPAAILCASVLLFGQITTFAWGNNGHTYINQVAAQKIPQSMPAFLRTSVAVARIAYLGPEPDRWRGTAEYALNDSQSPDHFIQLERVDGLGDLPPGRYEFYRLLYAKRAAAKANADDYLPENVGLQPYITMEIFERLRSAFREYRALKQKGENTDPVEQDIIFYAGWLGHYVADAAQPLHTTVNHDGWVEVNPNGYTTEQGIHWRYENDFVNRTITLKSFSGLVGPAKEVPDPFSDYQKYLWASHALVTKVYGFDKEKALDGAGSPGAVKFTEERLAAGAQMLLDLWYTAWLQSAQAAK